MSETGYFHTFPAVRGVQAGRPFYIAMCPMRLIPKIFIFDEDEVPPELRAQRILNRSRVPYISSYLVENPDDYTLSAITASVNGQVDFSPMIDTGIGQNMGTLSIPMDAQILINDGQHRRAAIEEAIKENKELSHDHISVLFFIDEGLRRSQQMFADLNKHAVRPSPSIGTLYDHREQFSELARYLVKMVTVFNQLTELEKSSISNRSTKLFTLSSIKNASQIFLNKGKKEPITNDEMEFTAAYWNEVVGNMPDWQSALRKEISTSELRDHYIHAHGVMLHAMGHVGADLVTRKPKTWQKSLKLLRKINWARTNNEWKDRAMIHGRISKANTNVTLTGNLIKNYMNIPLNNFEKELEDSIS